MTPAEFQQELIQWSHWLAPWHLTSITVTVTKETYVEMLQKIFPEDSPDISTSERVCVHAGRSTSTQIGDSNEVVQGSLSRETDHAEFRTHLAPKFTRSEPLTISFLGLYEIMWKKFLLQLVKWRIKSKRSSYQFLLKFCKRHRRIQPLHLKLYCGLRKNVWKISR